MAKFAIIIIAAAAALNIAAINGAQLQPPIHLHICDNKDDVLLPMPGNCNYFYMCINGKAITNSCGPLYHFNARTGHCDYPARAACQPNIVNSAKEEALNPIAALPHQIQQPPLLLVQLPRPPLIDPLTSPPLQPPRPPLMEQPATAHLGPPIIEQLTPPIHFRPPVVEHPTTSKFPPSKPMLLVRPPLILKSPLMKPPLNKNPSPPSPLLTDVVLPNRNVTASAPPVHAPVPHIPKPHHPDEVIADLAAGPICRNRPLGAFLPKPDSCSHYYVCIMERPYRRTCPPHLHFNATRLLCQDPVLAQCKAQKLNLPENSGKEETVNNVCVGAASSMAILPHHKNCSKFYICDNGRAITMACPEGLHFSKKEQRCEWPWIAECAL